MVVAPFPTPTAPFTVQRVVDTRDYIEQDDRFVPLPGTGQAHECDRCGRLHEIHAEVLDVNGHGWTVGIGCMGVTSGEARRLSNQAVSAARTAAKAAFAEEARRTLTEAEAAVEALDFPADRIEVGPDPVMVRKNGERWTLDEVYVVAWGDYDPAERLRSLETAWRSARLHELVGGREAYWRLRRLADYRPRGKS